ncbi:MAG: hypothetical protein NZ849_09275 [Meiothermus sp.]|uniref:hypothetical protein n=1 Tax=Meiothermus sp. TaxID=1955249 RepID=UPI0025F68FC5|nr:hypothetical protein [Meiothermus sp.]MCS7058910.1 hypothetical protein [Meiothermus sp.]MCS7195081.1 hypothetical protein [Meiothermus sp.]MCX7739762.1 hypothetical protein [Meiothermus sp.]MDW8090125.1 hypothetical protein [Meiothermus sp.]MDW8481428.1 hypothetical protein [Meiothermus sp.]
MLSWLDLMALLVLSAALALGIRRGAHFTLALVGALVLYGLLVLLAGSVLTPWGLPLLALVLGLFAAYLAQFIPLPPLSPTLEGLVGGVGGFLWGLFLACTIWVSFPSEFVASTGALRYPSERMPVAVKEGIVQSPFARPLFNWTSSHPTLRAALLPHIRTP